MPTDTMTRCVAATDLVVGYSPGELTLDRFDSEGVECLGAFASAREAWIALDAIDLAG